MVLSHLSPVEHVIQNLITSSSLVCARGPIAKLFYALLTEILQLLFGPWLNPSFWGKYNAQAHVLLIVILLKINI